MSKIDYGCGEGNLTVKLSKKSKKKVVGIDICEKSIESAKFFETENLKFYFGDGRKELEFNEEFDIAISMFVIQFAKTKEELKLFLSSMYKSLKKGGVVCGVSVKQFLVSKLFFV